jgi:proteasome assembly chaperone (PAC2) family protein
MSSIHIDLYSALTSANIDPDKAKAVVESLQEHIDMQVNRANETLIAKLDGVQLSIVNVQSTLIAKLDAIVSGRIEPIEKSQGQLVNDKQSRVQRVRWVVTTMMGTIIGGAGLLHALHVI